MATDLPDWAHGVQCVVVLSGAGVSTDSGIQDFRGPGGVWTLNPTARKKATYQAFISDPELRGRYWRSRYEHPVWQAEPNAGHLAVAGLTSSDLETTVVTQNTDGLHQRAGTPADQVVELHGTMHEVLCVDCGHRSATTDVLARIEAGSSVPDCLDCGGILKTASTMFGQTMAPAVFARAERAVISCDLVLAVGTTLTVEPAGSLAASAVRAGATLVIVNWDPTPYDGIATDLIRDPLGEALPRIAEQILDGATRPRPVPASEPAEEEAAALLRGGDVPESLLAVVTPTFLMNLFSDTTPEQERRALTVLARAATTRPALRDCLRELLSVLPGISPAAVAAAVHGDHPEPLAEALISLARNAALPADLLESVPAGTTVLGEFPILLAESLVAAYERRVDVYPATALPGLATMLIELAERLSDAGRVEEARAAADRAVAVAARLPTPSDLPTRAAKTQQRAALVGR